MSVGDALSNTDFLVSFSLRILRRCVPLAPSVPSRASEGVSDSLQWMSPQLCTVRTGEYPMLESEQTCVRFGSTGFGVGPLVFALKHKVNARQYFRVNLRILFRLERLFCSFVMYLFKTKHRNLSLQSKSNSKSKRDEAVPSPC